MVILDLILKGSEPTPTERLGTQTECGQVRLTSYHS